MPSNSLVNSAVSASSAQHGDHLTDQAHRNFLPEPEIIACQQCDLLVALRLSKASRKQCCPRCGFVLTHWRNDAQSKLIAFALTASIFLIFSLPFSFLSIESRGAAKAITLVDSFQSIAAHGYPLLSIILLSSTIILPASFLLGLLYTLTGCTSIRRFPLIKPVTRSLFIFLEWNMAEIFLLSVLISFIKIMSLARVELGLSFYAYILFIISLMTTISLLDRYQIWRWITQNEKR